MTVLLRRTDEIEIKCRTAVPMIGASPALEIVLWNGAAQALLGFSSGEMLGRRCFEVLGCPMPTRRLFCAGCGDRAGGQCVPGFAAEISSRSGARIPVDVTTVLAASGDGAPLRLHLLRETSRERQLEELLRNVVSAASRLSVREPRGRGIREAVPAPTRAVTAREREVMRLLTLGSSTAEIAASMRITRRTARNHIQNILTKLGVHSRLEAVACASARGLV